MTRASDPITLEIVKNALASIADEMALVVMRSAHSPLVRDSMDFSTAICDRHGQVIAQGLTNPIHLGSFPDVMSRIVANHSEDMHDGDGFLVNDPYGSGGMHLPDVFLITPIYVDGEVEAFAGTVVHHADVGGMAPGSMALAATEIFQEGLRIPIIKLFEKGVLNRSVMGLLEANSRTPDALRGDLGAQIASIRTCEAAVTQLVNRYGSQALRGYIEELHAYAERLMRQEIAKMAPGVYEFEDWLDGLGENPEPLYFKVKVTIDGGHALIDWEGTGPQVQGAINAPIATTRSMGLCAIRSAVGVEMPNFAGYMRPVELRAPEGSLVNPVLPAACAARGVIAYRMLDCLFGALAKVPGSRLPAQGEGGPSVVTLSGWEGPKAWLITDGVLGSWGGRPTIDGVDGIASPGTNLSNQPIEIIEARLPLRVTSYGLLPNSGGAGRTRGGLAVYRGYEILAKEGNLTLRSDRRRHLPSGAEGGLPGTPSVTYLHTAAGPELLPVMPMQARKITRGDSVLHIAAGGAGYGDVLARDPEAVLDDVRDDKIDAAMAAEVYGVIIDQDSWTIDATRTAEKRSALQTQPRKAHIRAQFAQFARRNKIDIGFLDAVLDRETVA